LQPLVENSIFQGFRNQTEGGRIHITIYKTEDHLCLRVKDNGMGFQQNVDDKNATSEQSKSGYALHNIRERIQLYYGEQAGLRIDSELGEGTTITIVIPWKGAALTYGD